MIGNITVNMLSLQNAILNFHFSDVLLNECNNSKTRPALGLVLESDGRFQPIIFTG